MRKLWLLLGLAGCVLAQNPNVPPNSVVNGASFAPMQQVSPGSLVSVFGTELAQSTAHADSIPISTKLANVEVTFNGVASPLLDVVAGQASSQINAQLPWNVLPQGTTTGTVSIVVTVNGVSSNSQAVQVGAPAPGIFTINNQGTGQASVLIGNTTTVAAPAGSIPGRQSRPVKKGEVIVVFATGAGPVDSAIANGVPPPSGQLVRTTATPGVLFGGVPADAGGVQFSGLAPGFVGLNQINVVVPQGAPSGNTVSLQLEMGGVATTNQVTIAIE